MKSIKRVPAVMPSHEIIRMTRDGKEEELNEKLANLRKKDGMEG